MFRALGFINLLVGNIIVALVAANHFPKENLFCFWGAIIMVIVGTALACGIIKEGK